MPKTIPLPLEVFPPLDAAIVGEPPWEHPRQPDPATAPPSCDVVIVGAGITGLSAAIACGAAGHHVVVLERAFGSGATSRSGGVVLGETVEGPDPEFDGCEETLRHWIQDSGADCDVRWCGCLELTRDPRLPRTPIDWTDDGAVRLAGRVSGGVLDPSKLQQALLTAAGAAGVTIVDQTTVVNVTKGHRGVSVSTNREGVSARAGIMAVDAMCWRRGFDPWWQRVMTVSLQTVPLTEASLAALGLRADEAFYTVSAPLLWGRVMPDRSLLVGRETRPFPRTGDPNELQKGLRQAGDRLGSRVRHLHPALATIEIRRIWTGPLARTAAGHPLIAVDPFAPRLLWAGGYGGQGIAQAFTLGRQAAGKILEISRSHS